MHLAHLATYCYIDITGPVIASGNQGIALGFTSLRDAAYSRGVGNEVILELEILVVSNWHASLYRLVQRCDFERGFQSERLRVQFDTLDPIGSALPDIEDSESIVSR